MKNLVLIGTYGSGKTQLAINLALDWKREFYSSNVALIDLDVVNPYFRSRELAPDLEKMGVDMVLPQRDFVLSEAPALPPAISGKLKEEGSRVILDVGGDTAGATVLGRYHNEINETETDVWMVVNVCRPDTSSCQEIINTANSLANCSRLKITGFVNNTNLGLETTPDLIKEGFVELSGAAKQMQIPVVMTTVHKDLYARVNELLVEHNKIYAIEIYLRPDWYGKGKGGGF